MSRPRHVAAALLDRATAVRPVARGRELIRAIRAEHCAGPAPDGLPYPPGALRVLVMRGLARPERFWSTGREASQVILETLRRGGVDPDGLGTVLDFGCGCGRIARHFRERPWDLHGCDLNPRAAAWCDANLPFLTAAVNGMEPPAPYASGTFDLVYAYSVLTHLTEPVGRAWIDEWRRIVKPGGLVLATTIGDAFRHQLNDGARSEYDRGRPVVTKPRIEGMNACVAHHPREYVTRTLLDGLEVIAHTPGGTVPGIRQDAWLARVR